MAKNGVNARYSLASNGTKSRRKRYYTEFSSSLANSATVATVSSHCLVWVYCSRKNTGSHYGLHAELYTVRKVLHIGLGDGHIYMNENYLKIYKMCINKIFRIRV